MLSKLFHFQMLYFTAEHQKPDQDMYAVVPAAGHKAFLTRRMSKHCLGRAGGGERCRITHPRVAGYCPVWVADGCESSLHSETLLRTSGFGRDLLLLLQEVRVGKETPLRLCCRKGAGLREVWGLIAWVRAEAGSPHLQWSCVCRPWGELQLSSWAWRAFLKRGKVRAHHCFKTFMANRWLVQPPWAAQHARCLQGEL